MEEGDAFTFLGYVLAGCMDDPFPPESASGLAL
jgi:hypothetical protein